MVTPKGGKQRIISGLYPTWLFMVEMGILPRDFENVPDVPRYQPCIASPDIRILSDYRFRHVAGKGADDSAVVVDVLPTVGVVEAPEADDGDFDPRRGGEEIAIADTITSQAIISDAYKRTSRLPRLLSGVMFPPSLLDLVIASPLLKDGTRFAARI
ncbi:MAG: hypothetical protein OK455_00990 [Thaumarchaeota archaeon]|nr:hypothetical protein [Nitrososphaerota archaeon]